MTNFDHNYDYDSTYSVTFIVFYGSKSKKRRNVRMDRERGERVC